MGNNVGRIAVRHPLALLTLASGCCFLLGRRTASSPATKTAAAATMSAVGAKTRAPVEGAFWLVVAVVFQQEEDVATFGRAFKPLADYVTMKEPATLSYGYAKSDADPRRILIFERYASKNDYLDVHKVSEPFLAFRPKLAALGADIDGHSYYEGALGFI